MAYLIVHDLRNYLRRLLSNTFIYSNYLFDRFLETGKTNGACESLEFFEDALDIVMTLKQNNDRRIACQTIGSSSRSNITKSILINIMYLIAFIRPICSVVIDDTKNRSIDIRYGTNQPHTIRIVY